MTLPRTRRSRARRQTRELAELMITKASVGPMDNNAYFLRCRADRRDRC